MAAPLGGNIPRPITASGLPVLGDDVTVAAGSALTRDVPSGALAFGRAKQVVKQNWQPSSEPAS
mgnify:CR=1 FL=1